MRKVVFGAESLSGQVQRLVALLGIPPQHILKQIKDQNVVMFLTECERNVMTTCFEEILPEIEPDALDLLSKLLTYDPDQRISAEEALNHPYFNEIHKRSLV